MMRKHVAECYQRELLLVLGCGDGQLSSSSQASGSVGQESPILDSGALSGEEVVEEEGVADSIRSPEFFHSRAFADDDQNGDSWDPMRGPYRNEATRELYQLLRGTNLAASKQKALWDCFSKHLRAAVTRKEPSIHFPKLEEIERNIQNDALFSVVRHLFNFHIGS